MTREEFLKAMHYVSIAVRKSLNSDELEVYFDLLGDLEYGDLCIGAKRVLLEHRYPTFPSVAELRAATIATSRGEVTEQSSAEAWAIAWRAIGRIDHEVDGSFDRATKGLDSRIVETIRSMGVAALCQGTEPVTVIRAQFAKAYDQIAARERRSAILPAATREAIQNRAVVNGIVNSIASTIGDI